MNKLVRFLYYLLVIVVPLLMYSGTSELFEFNKMLYIYLTASFVLTLWLIDIVVHKKSFIHSTLLDIGIGLFLLSQALSTYFSMDPHTSFFGYYGRFNGGLLSIIAYTVLFYGFIQYFDRTALIKLLKISLVVSCIVVLWGIPGKLGHDMSCWLFTSKFDNSCWTDQFRPSERMFSTLGQPNWLGAYLAIHFFITLYFLFVNHTRRIISSIPFWIYSSSLAFNFVGLLFTRSRSSLVAVGACFLLFLGGLIAIIPKKEWKHRLLNRLLVIGSVCVLTILLFKTGVPRIDSYITLPARGVVPAPVELQKSASPAPKEVVTESFDIRKIVWEGATKLGMQNPLFGSGVETFAYAYYWVRPTEHNLTSEWDYLYNKAHNEYLNYFGTTGYIGLGAYLIMIGSVLTLFVSHIKRSLHADGKSAIPLFALLSAYLAIHVTNFFGFSTTTVNIFFYLIPAFVIVTAHEAIPVFEKRRSKLSFVQQSMIIAIFGWALYSSMYVGRYFWADTLYSTADRYVLSDEHGEAARLLEQALDMRYEHVYEDKLSFVFANLSYIAAYQKEQDLSKSLMDLSELYNKKTLNATPKNVLYWKTRAKNEYLFYQTTQDIKHVHQALSALNNAEKLSPTDPKLSYSIALFYSLLEDEGTDAAKKEILRHQALESIDRAIGLKKDFKDTYVLKAQLLKKFGRTDESRALYEQILQQFDPNDTEIKKEMSK